MGKTPCLDSLIKELEVNITILKDAVRKGEIKIAEGAHARIEVFTQAIYGSELYPAYECRLHHEFIKGHECWCGLKANHDGNCKPLDEQ